MMKAVVVNAPGDLSALSVQDISKPVVAPGHVLIKVQYAACNWGDVQKRQGIYPDPVHYPCVLGAEGAGYITELAADVSELHQGQAVMFIAGLHMFGAFAEYVCVPADLAIPIASNECVPEHAALPVAALTAYHLLNTAYRLCSHHKLLVHSVSGGVGLMVTQWAAQKGAYVFGTVGSPSKIAQAKDFGAQRVVARAQEDFVQVIMDETQGKGVDLVIDSLGADILERSFGALSYFGHLINIGEAAGDPEFDIRKTLYQRSTSMAGFEVRHAYELPERWRAGIAALQAAIASARLHMPIDRIYDLDEIDQAQARMESRQTVGKIVIKVGA